MERGQGFWQVQTPLVWPVAPASYSYSSLHEIETCPLRWATAHAGYGSLWPGRGYPRKPAISALSGDVVHRSISTITRASEGPGETGPASIAHGLRELGGISKVLERSVIEVVTQWRSNPRAHDDDNHFLLALSRRLPEFRLAVQTALNAMASDPGTVLAQRRSRSPGERGALEPGWHSETRLAPASVNCVGVADLIRLSNDLCQIVDYKTGAPSPSHEDQIRLYALLWARDKAVNPSGRLANSLMLVYPGQILDVQSPDDAGLVRLEEATAARTGAAAKAIAGSPPQAQVSVENCRFCDVKQLCSPYWTSASQAAVRETPAPIVRSLQGFVDGCRGDSTWTVVLELDPYLDCGTAGVVTVPARWHLTAGQRVRFMDARVDTDAAEIGVRVGLGSSSELFVVDGLPSTTAPVDHGNA